MTAIRDLYDRLEKTSPGTWEYRDLDEYTYDYLTAPVGYLEALEIEVANTDACVAPPEFALTFRRWDQSYGLADEVYIMSVSVDLLDTAARMFGWYLTQGLSIGEYGEVVL